MAEKPHCGTQPSTALRNRAPAPAACQQCFNALTVAGLDILDQKISQKQEGQHLGGVHQRFAQNIQKQFHIHS